MADERAHRTSLTVAIILLVFVLAGTIWLPLFLTSSALRPATFGFSIGFACFLELLLFLYFSLLFIPGVRRTAVWSVYPAIGIAVSTYTVVGILTVFLVGRNAKLYTALVAVETLLFLIVLGALAILNVVRKPEEEVQFKERRQEVNLRVAAVELRQRLDDKRERLELEPYGRCAAKLRRLEERCERVTPFGRPGVESIEAEMQTSLAKLRQLIDSVGDLPKESRTAALEEVGATTEQVIHALDRRERLSVK